METDNKINSIVSIVDDFWHYKIIDLPIKKEDYFSSEFFSERITEPFEIYEQHLRAVEFDKRICYISVETPNHEFPFALPEALEEAFDKEFMPDEVSKRFVGEYDEEMKKEISRYIKDMGFQGLRKEEFFFKHEPGCRHMPYSCNIYRQYYTLGFYLKRIGVLRGCFSHQFYDDAVGEETIYGGRSNFEELGNNFDKDYIKHQYGEDGWKRIKEYYQKNFLDSFEYGVSLLHRNNGYFEH